MSNLSESYWSYVLLCAVVRSLVESVRHRSLVEPVGVSDVSDIVRSLVESVGCPSLVESVRGSKTSFPVPPACL